MHPDLRFSLRHRHRQTTLFLSNNIMFALYCLGEEGDFSLKGWISEQQQPALQLQLLQFFILICDMSSYGFITI